MSTAEHILPVGIVGYGGMGKLHANNAKKLGLFEIKTVADVSAEKRQLAEAELGVRTYDDYREMLDKEDIDAVFVTTHPNTHAKICVEAANRGKHIFCEKPFTPSLAEARKALRAITRTKVVFQLGMVLRYTRSYELLRTMISNRELGDILAAQARYGGYLLGYMAHFRRGFDRGMVNGNTIHMIDMLHFLLGPVKEIWARFDRHFPRELEKAAVICFQHKNGVISSLYASGAMRAGAFLLINGSQADVIVDGNSSIVRFSQTGSQELLKAEPGFPQELEAFWRNVVRREPNLVGTRETLELSNLMESIYRAAIRRSMTKVPRVVL